MRRYFALALISAAVPAFQLVLMQVLSVAQWHHFAWMVISMAMLGFGAAGTVLHLLRRVLADRQAEVFPLLLVCTALTMAGVIPFLRLTGTFDAFLLFFETRQIGLLLLTYLLLALPFFCAGMAITLLLYTCVDRIGPVYFANLLGSGLGAAATVILMRYVPLENLPIMVATLPLVGAVIVVPGARSTGFTGPTIASVILSVIVVVLVFPILLMRPVLPEPSQYKDISAALRLPGAGVVHRRSDPAGLLQVVRAKSLRYAPGLSLQYREEPPVRDVLFSNGDYFGTLAGRVETAYGHPLNATTRILPYLARTPRRALVLEARTGNDVAQALNNGVQEVTAVESNRAAATLLTREHPEWIDDLFLDPRVSFVVGTARSILKSPRTEEFDLISAPVVGSFGGTSGVTSLDEHYHLTLEAFSHMYAALAEGGMIAATVWLEDPPRPALRLLATLREMLVQEGVDNPASHLTAIRSWGSVTFLASNRPFTTVEAQAIRAGSASLGFDPLILPDLHEGERSRFNRPASDEFFVLVDRILAGEDLEDYWFNARPATDHRPYFFHFLRVAALPELIASFGIHTLPYLELGFFLALAAAGQALVVAVVLIVLPLTATGTRRLPSRSRRGATFLFFAGTGAGFMLFEISLIQQIVLYLGQPVYAAATVLTVLLIASGMGSFFTTGIRRDRPAIITAGLTTVLLLGTISFVLQPLLHATIGLPLGFRIAITILVTALPGFGMGMFFPLGLRRLAGGASGDIPWACAIDSCVAVAVIAPTTLIALGTGSNMVMALAAGAYGVTTIVSTRLGPRA